jgi:tetratricopeptide (TPR) repeat protein
MQLKPSSLLILLAVLLFSAIRTTFASGTSLRGIGVDALDGETINVKVDNRVITVRLCAVTAPKKGQVLADVARNHLDLLTKGKQVLIDYNILGRDAIIVGIVTVDGMDVGMQMIRDGAALYNRRYQADVPQQSQSLYEQSEQAARAEARGVWENHPDLSLEELETGSPASGESGSQRAKRLSNEAHEMILQGNFQGAMARVREAIRWDPKLADAHKNLALIFFHTIRYEDGLPEAREAVRLAPEFDESHNVLGVILCSLGNVEGAIKEFNRAIAINPGYGLAYYNLGFSYDRIKQFEKALAAYQQAERRLERPSERAITQVNIGRVLYELGRRAEARQRWQRVLTMGDRVAAALAEQNLQNSR